jgi:hypothetical protein
VGVGLAKEGNFPFGEKCLVRPRQYLVQRLEDTDENVGVRRKQNSERGDCDFKSPASITSITHQYVTCVSVDL